MLSILVGHSYFLGFDHKQHERAKPYPPLATLQTAAALRNDGHRVAVFDAMLSEGPAEFEQRVGELRPELVVLYEDNFNFLSKMCLGRMREAACRMIGGARRAGARVLVAGSDASDLPRVYLEAGADAVLLGEGLIALHALVARLDGARSQSLDALSDGIGGIAFRRGGEIRLSSGGRPAASARHPDAPAFDLIDVERYRKVWRAAHGYFSLNLSASRGCSFRCNWCAKPIWGNQYLQRPAPAVAAEMAALKHDYAPDHVWFADDIFGFRVAWVQEFAAALRALGGGIPFTVQTRADLTSARMARALREAGCQEAWIGAESGSQRVLDAMDKGTTVEQLHAARARLKSEGIRVGFFIQLGYLGEELSDILATRALIETARPDAIGVSVSYPLPGTKFYERVKEQLGPKTHWSESDDLAMMFEGTYSSEFYRAVRDLLHLQVDRDQASLLGTTPPVTAAALEHRWRELLGAEHRYRLGPAEPTAEPSLGPVPAIGVA